MALEYTQSRKLSGIGSESESDFYTRWLLLKVQSRRMCLHSTWDKPLRSQEQGNNGGAAPPEDEVGFISDLDFSPTGRLLAASSTGNAIFVFDPNRGSLVKAFDKPHGDAVSKVCFVGDYQFVSGSADSTVAYWDMRFPSGPMRFLRGHRMAIRCLSYLFDCNLLVTGSQDGHVRHWHVPTFAAGYAGEETTLIDPEGSEEDSAARGVLIKCPNLSMCRFSEGMAVCANSRGTMFVIDNLDVRHVQEDTKNIHFDESTKMQLCWFTPSAHLSKRNRVRVLESDEYSPMTGAIVTNISHFSFHSNSPISLMRVTTTRQTLFSKEVKEWTCVYNMKQERLQDDTSVFNIYSFGSSIIQEALLFMAEEPRYLKFREKQPCFSLCGRVIASPHKTGIRLLGFSTNTGTCLSPVRTSKSPCHMDSLFRAGYWPSNPSPLKELLHIPGPDSAVICCKFSPTDNMLLAVGDSHCHVGFYKPKL